MFTALNQVLEVWNAVGGDLTTFLLVVALVRVRVTVVVDRTNGVRTWNVRLTL
ncbi:hypothetical protein OH460_09030 [Vibrio sp. Makdt]|uniref:hypothetical protein n=1 Tax=Vibrio sp. Makdt TaxID=2998828 RepID=UPI0022CD9EE1|nr:hypothetical protein [Vibrio sp. Makdt]MDA0152445.1 hypothetical protein [Vibrio sp. Makdt]